MVAKITKTPNEKEVVHLHLMGVLLEEKVFDLTLIVQTGLVAVAAKEDVDKKEIVEEIGPGW